MVLPVACAKVADCTALDLLGAAKAEALKAAHPEAVTVVESPAAVLGACDVSFCMLSTPEACKVVYEMPGGVLEGVAPGKCVVELTRARALTRALTLTRARALTRALARARPWP